MPSSQSRSAESGSHVGGADEGSAENSFRRRFVEAARRAAIVGLVNAATSEGDLARRFTDELCEVFDAEVGFMLDGGEERQPARVIRAVGLDSGAAGALLRRYEYANAVDSRRGVLLSGTELLGVGARGAMLAPFQTEDGRSIVVGVARQHTTPFDQIDRSLLEQVTVAAGQALERIWAYEARNRRAKEQAALVRAAKSIGRSLEVSDVLATIADEVRSALDADSVSCALGDEASGYEVIGVSGLSPEFVGFRQPPGTGIGGRALEAGRTLVTQRYQEEGYAPPETSAMLEVRSALAVLLKWDDRVRGFMSVGFNDARRIAQNDINLLEGFAELASMACGNAERHAEVREAAEVDGLTGCFNRDGFSTRLSRTIDQAAERGIPVSLAILDLDGFKAINDVFGHPSGDRVLKGVGSALRSSVRGGDVVARYGGDEFALILPKAGEREAGPVLDRVRAAISSMQVPGGRLTACVGLAERNEDESMEALISRADDALRQAKGTLSPGSVRSARRLTSTTPASQDETTAGRRQRWRAIAGDIGLNIAHESDPAVSSAIAARELQDTLQLELCSILRLVSDGRLEVVAEAGPGAPSASFRDADEGLIGRAMREKRRVRSDDWTEVVTPLIVGGRVWGACACESGRRRLDDIDIDLLARVSDHLSAAARAGELYEQLTESMIGTAEALAAALEAKDSYTADHAHSISELAVKVGREMQLSESALEDLRYGGIFHDVGKIAIPDALINKPGPLTDEEFEVLKTHPEVGAEILAPVPFLYGVRTIVRHAHEHWDGGGYPEGLRGEQIPLGARIVLAVDAYHAMTSNRPYRRAMSHEKACEELVSCSGTHFDPEVVEALLAVLKRGARSTA